MAAFPLRPIQVLPASRLAFLLVILCIAFLPLVPRSAEPLSAPQAPQRIGGLPVLFVPSQSQGAVGVYYQAQVQGGSVAFREGAIELAWPATEAAPAVRVEFAGAAQAAPAPASPPSGVLNLAQGADPAGWKTGIPLYTALFYTGLYPGIDLRYEGEAGQLKGTYQVAPRADAALIRWRYAGAERVSVTAAGDLLVQMPGGQALTERAPRAWQEIAGQAVPVAVYFVVERGEVSFAVGDYNPAFALTIDPTLVFSTFAGGNSGDYARGLTLDAQGNLYVVGDTLSANFLGLTYTPQGSNDVVVMKLNPAGTGLIYATIVGGSSTDKGLAVAVNSAGQAYVTVEAGSANFPLLNALYPTKAYGNDGALLKLAANGTLAFSTWLPMGYGTYAGRNVAVDGQGNVVVTGELYEATSVRRDLAVLKLNASGTSLHWGLAWSDDHVPDSGAAVAIGPNDKIYVAGQASGPFGDLAVTGNALQPLCGRQTALGTGVNCDQDAVVVILNANGSEQYVSYWGGQGDDHATGIAVAGDGSFVITGNTNTPGFHGTPGALMADCPVSPSTNFCFYDSFVANVEEVPHGP